MVTGVDKHPKDHKRIDKCFFGSKYACSVLKMFLTRLHIKLLGQYNYKQSKDCLQFNTQNIAIK